MSVLQSFARWEQSCFVVIMNEDIPLVLKDRWNKERGREDPGLSCDFVFNSKYEDFDLCRIIAMCM